MNKEMHHLVIGDDSFEVVDNSARNRLDNHDVSIAAKANSADVDADIERIDELIGDDTLTTEADTLTGAVNELDAKRSDNIAAGYLTTAKALLTSYSIVPIGDDYMVGSSFVRVNDGGYRALKSGLVLISAFCHIANVNSGDTVQVSIGRYNGGWVYESIGHFAVGIATDRSCSIPTLAINVNENDIIYIRARNATAARGNVTSARMTIEIV